jgi:hypothetical protein
MDTQPYASRPIQAEISKVREPTVYFLIAMKSSSAGPVMRAGGTLITARAHCREAASPLRHASGAGTNTEKSQH